MKNKKIVAIVFAVLALLFVVLAKGIFKTNEAGYFQVKQAALTGNMSVRFAAGTYFRWFGAISEYRNVTTCGIGAHKGDGSADIDAVDVIFNDGSKAKISGLIRVKLPNTQEGAINLKREYAAGFEHFIQSGVVPIVNNAIKLSANLRSAQDAYTTLALFQQAVEDQLRNGIYVTKSDKVVITRSNGDTEEQKITAIVYGADGQPLRMPNRLQQLGCEVLECVIDVPAFDSKVEEMISKRKDEAMKTELAKQEAIRAQQDAITAEQQGLANVAKAKYEKEVEKVQEVTTAQKEYEVAQLNAKKEDENRKAKIYAGEGEAEAARLKVAAGLTPQERMDMTIKIADAVSKNIAGASTPSVVFMGGGAGSGPDEVMKIFGAERSLELIKKFGVDITGTNVGNVKK
jgi:hypothetical protein